MMVLDSMLEEIACSYYGYELILSEFRYFGYDDGSSIVEVNEIGKTPKRLKITISIEELESERR